jgi:transposase
MTTARVEVITSVQRRRKWSMAEKERVVAAALEPGASASEVARAAGIHTSQVFRWRRQLARRNAVAPGFAAVTIAPSNEALPAPVAPSPPGVIEIEFASGRRLRITGVVDPAMVSSVIAALAAVDRRR